MVESWAPFPNNPDYSISTYGRVINNRNNRLRSPTIDRDGYKRITMYESGRYATYYIHRVVAEAFLEGFRDNSTIRFKSDDRSDCHVDNIEILKNLSERLPNSRPRIHAKRVRIIELNKVFRNAIAAAMYIGGDIPTIYKCLRGERHSHLGYTFEYQNTSQALEYLKNKPESEFYG